MEGGDQQRFSGIILSFFGTVLLVTSLFVRASLDVADGPAYLNVLHRPTASSNPTAPAADGTQPLDLNDLEKLGTQKDSSAPGQTQK